MSNSRTAHSYAMADIAMAQIKSLELPADPTTYELWYSYTADHNRELNAAINKRLSEKGRVTESDVEELHARFFEGKRGMAHLDEAGLRVMGEIDQVMGMIDAAIGTTSSYGESLAGATRDLSTVTDRDQLRAVVASLVASTREAEAMNRDLEARLSASKSEIGKLQDSLEKVRTESLIDPLTGLANRKAFDQSLAKAIADAEATGEPLTLLLTDIDHFKRFNDTFGHLTGDQVLRLVAMALKQNVKGLDVAARYGGEEFAVILPQTPLRAALTVAEHIRRAIMTKELLKRSTGEQLGRLTVSVGASVFRPGDTAASLIERADACLYTAKRTGRNRVVCETDPDVSPMEDAKVA
jgi:diguanylate cyclase